MQRHGDAAPVRGRGELAAPGRPRGTRRGAGAPSARGSTGATHTDSSPSASSTQTARSSPSGSASRARTPGSASSVRAGPSRWVSRWTVPRTVTTLVRPVRSGTAWPSHCAVVMRCGSRAVRGPPSRTSSRRGVGVQRVEDPQLARRLVDHPRAVRARVPHVERRRAGPAVVGVAAQVPARRGRPSRGSPSPRGRTGTRSGRRPASATRAGRRSPPAAGRTRRCRRRPTTACPRCRRGSASTRPTRASGSWPAARRASRRRARGPTAGRGRAAAAPRRPPGRPRPRSAARAAWPADVSASTSPDGVQPRRTAPPHQVSRRAEPPSASATNTSAAPSRHDVHATRVPSGREPRGARPAPRRR